MKLRTKAIIYFGSFLILIVGVIIFFSQYVVSRVFVNQTINDLRIFAEQTEGAYFTFLKTLKAMSIGLSSDPVLQSIVKSLLSEKEGTEARAKLAKEFSNYIVREKLPYEKTLFLVDLLDKDGIVIASTRTERIGVNEKEEENLSNVSYFSKSIDSNIGEAYVRSLVFEEDENPEPVAHVTVRAFAKNSNNEQSPLDGVLLFHYLSIRDIADVLSGQSQIEEGAITGKALLSTYDTTEIYMVNSERLLVTPTRDMKDLKFRQVISTLPVNECLENGREVNTEYDNQFGRRVFGATMCFEKEKLVLIVEVDKSEILAPLYALLRVATIGTILFFFIGTFIVFFFIRSPLQRINAVVSALDKVMKGDLSAEVPIGSNDEIGRLNEVFNATIEAIRANKELLRMKISAEENELIFKKDIEEHERQRKFFDESKKATLNLLEDAWKTKERLEEEKNKMQTILSSIGDGLILIDPDYKVSLANAKASEIFSMPREELLNKNLHDIASLYKDKNLVDPKSWPTEEVFLSKKSIATTIEDNYYITTKGRQVAFPISFSIAPIIGNIPGVIIVIRDITKEHELDEAKNGFISVASHQLRTPLTSIRWYSEMLLSEDAGPLNVSQKDFMNEIHGGAERLYQTVDLLLGISRVESGKLKVDKSQIDLKMLTEEIIKELASEAKEKEINILVESPEVAPENIWLDPLTLRQVIMNLISNAIRYSNEKGTVTVRWSINDIEKSVQYSVSDAGIGVPESQRGRIFTKFFRAENARAQVPDGSGLGLALVKDLVSSWKGKVWFDSTEGQGATFFFTIPVEVAENTGSVSM